MKKHVIAYLHTHWDREWYREFEIFRMRLLRVFDSVIELLIEGRIPSFYFDGQVCALEDYLEIRPEKTEIVKQLIKEKKLFIGPFYCLIDEFLTDRTCFEKNIEIGMKKAVEFGCTDFIGYLPDTFGHSKNVPEILRKYNLDKCVVWRGCGDFPAEFKWCGIDTVNLVRGYFNDIFSIKDRPEKKAKLLKHNLDLISEKSGEYILLPIGADHLGVEKNIKDMIDEMNEHLADDYEITLSSPFDYFEKVKGRFEHFRWNDELRDNSKTFVLQGCYSSRNDLKRENIESTYILDLASRFVKQQKEEKNYSQLIDYAYKMLIKNQAHDSICGCSTDDVHSENLIRFKKIKQISNTIIDELKFKNRFEEKKILNLSGKPYSGIIEFSSAKKISGYDRIGYKKGFDKYLLTDTQRIPVTEDYTNIYTYITAVENLEPNQIEYLMPAISRYDLRVSDTSIENSNIKLNIKDGNVYINGIPLSITDYIDLGDSYNYGPKHDDIGSSYKVLRSKVLLNTLTRVSLKIDFEGVWDVVTMIANLDKNSGYINLDFCWVNSRKNHLLSLGFDMENGIHKVYSEDMNTLIKREFDPNYDIRKNLPGERGKEAKTNTAPMQRGLLIDEGGNNLGIITKGICQYEVFKNRLSLPLLRASGRISDPMNTARTTPAGPPIETENLQQIGDNSACIYVFFGNKEDFKTNLDKIYNYIIT